MAFNDNVHSSLNGDEQTILNGKRVKQKPVVREIESTQEYRKRRPTQPNQQAPTPIKQKRKINLGTPIVLILFCILFVGGFFIKDFITMPYEFNKSIPLTLMTVDSGNFNLTVQNDDRYEDVFDKVNADWIESNGDTLIKDAQRYNKQYGDKTLTGTRFDCKPLSGKGILTLQHTTTKGSAGVAVIFGKNNDWGVICEQWYEKVQFTINSIKIDKMSANADDATPDVILQFTHFPNKYKKDYEEIEMHIWLEENQTTNISLEQISDNEYAVISTIPISKIDIKGSSINKTVESVGTHFVYKAS